MINEDNKIKFRGAVIVCIYMIIMAAGLIYGAWDADVKYHLVSYSSEEFRDRLKENGLDISNKKYDKSDNKKLIDERADEIVCFGDGNKTVAMAKFKDKTTAELEYEGTCDHWPRSSHITFSSRDKNCFTYVTGDNFTKVYYIEDNLYILSGKISEEKKLDKLFASIIRV